MKRLFVAAALSLLCLCGRAFADPATVTLDGLVTQTLHLTQADLAAMPATEVDIAFQTDHGPETAHYKGVLLWSLLQKAGLAVEPGDKRTVLHHYILVTGADHYAVILSIGELAPDFEGKQVILAYDRAGKPLDPGEVRLIVPGDKHGGRAVRNVADIAVK